MVALPADSDTRRRGHRRPALRSPRRSTSVIDSPKETVAALGENGTNVLVRLSAFILLCIGIEIMWFGYCALDHVAG